MKSLALMFLPLAAVAQITSSPMAGGGGSTDLSGVVPVTRTVNGHALSSDVTVAVADLSELQDALDAKASNGDLSTVAFSGDYGDLTNSPDFEPVIGPGATTFYWRGDKSWAGVEQLTFDNNTFGVIDSGIWGPSANDKIASQDQSTYFDNSGFHGNASSLTGLPAQVTAGSFSGVGTATTTFTVTIGVTEADMGYKVNVTPTAALSAALFYVSGKTTTTFDVHYLTGLTGTVTFDWAVFP